MEKWFLMWFIFSGPNPYDPNTVVDGLSEDPYPNLTECMFDLTDKVRALEILEAADPTMSHMIFCQDLSWEVKKKLEEE